MSTSFSLQKKVAELESLEEYFRQPDMDLETAITKHTQALELAKEILDYLAKAESKLEQINIEELFNS